MSFILVLLFIIPLLNGQVNGTIRKCCNETDVIYPDFSCQKSNSEPNIMFDPIFGVDEVTIFQPQCKDGKKIIYKIGLEEALKYKTHSPNSCIEKDGNSTEKFEYVQVTCATEKSPVIRWCCPYGHTMDERNFVCKPLVQNHLETTSQTFQYKIHKTEDMRTEVLNISNFRNCRFEEKSSLRPYFDPHSNYTCVDYFEGKWIYGLCNEEDSKSDKPKILKCCGENEILQFPNCIPNVDSANDTQEVYNHLNDFFEFTGFNITCPFGLHKLTKNYWHFDPDLNVEILKTKTTKNRSNVCIDSDNLNADLGNVDVYVCISSPYRKPMLELILLSISCIFFIVTILIYCLPFLRRRHGKCTICYLCSYGGGFVFTCITYSRDIVNTPFYLVLAYLIEYCFFATIVWLSLMSFDVFQAICDISINNPSTLHSSTKKLKDNMQSESYDEELKENSTKFHKYASIAFILPIVMVIITIICDNIDWIPKQFRPNITKETAWFSEYILVDGGRFVLRTFGELLFFFTFLISSLFISFCFLTVASIKYIRMKNLERLKFGNSYNPDFAVLRSYSNQVILNWSLFLSMLIPTLGTIALVIMETLSMEYLRIYTVFKYSSGIYAFEGIIIFVMLVLCKPEIMKTLISINKASKSGFIWNKTNMRFGMNKRNDIIEDVELS